MTQCWFCDELCPDSDDERVCSMCGGGAICSACLIHHAEHGCECDCGELDK